MNKALNFLKEKIDNAFLNFIDSDDIKRLAPNFLYPVGAVLISFLLVIYLLIFIYGYESEINQTFLSPASENSSYCKSISVSNTGQYLASQDGYWEGSIDFKYSDAAYIITLVNLAYTQSEYVDDFTYVFESLEELGSTLLPYLDLGINLILWMSYTQIGSLSGTQRFSLAGSPLQIFNRQKTYGAIIGVNGTCNVFSRSVFDSKNGVFTLTYDNVEALRNNSNCLQAIVDPSLFGYLPIVDGNSFSISFDSRAMISTLAVNMKLLQTEYLVQIHSFNFTFDNVNYSVHEYYDPKYKAMQPIKCTKALYYNDESVCIMQIGSVYALPFFNHVGMSEDYSLPCDCGSLSREDLNDEQHPCNLFKFVSGFVFYPTSSPNELFQLIMQQYNADNKLYGLNQKTAYASFVASYYGKTSIYKDYLQSSAYLTNAFDFCNLQTATSTNNGNNNNIKNRTCSMLTFTSFDVFYSTGDNNAINEDYFQVKNGACRDTISMPKNTWFLKNNKLHILLFIFIYIKSFQYKLLCYTIYITVFIYLV
jgi:hypothetical protein